MGNFAYDAGMGVGAVAFGRLAAGTGYSWAFALIAWPCSVQFGPAPRAPSGRRLTGKRPGQAPIFEALEEPELLRRVRHQQILGLLVVHTLSSL
ncbi:hypothetical protein ABR738_05100 [Streptomyces sp. Edi4]|uniref:hypothetical protein n=1 Tax=Streptomyces sp. Edi4 TaxID=3162527 RepID=UPI0033058981